MKGGDSAAAEKSNCLPWWLSLLWMLAIAQIKMAYNLGKLYLATFTLVCPSCSFQEC